MEMLKMYLKINNQITFDDPDSMQELVQNPFFVNYQGSDLFGGGCDSGSSDINYYLVIETIDINK